MKASFALGSMVLALQAAAAPVAQDFAYARPIEVDEQASVYRIALPPEVYSHTVRGDFGDLRVINARGEVVPYAVKRPPGQTSGKLPPVSLPLFPLRGDPVAALEAVRVTIESGSAAVNVRAQGVAPAAAAVMSYLADARGLRAPIAALQLDWPEDAAEFAGRLRVEASDELGSWRAVIDAAPVANLHADGSRLVERRVEFRAARAKYWRITWVGAAPAFTLTGLHAEPAAEQQDVRRSELTLTGQAVADHPGELEFDLGARLPVDRVNLELPERNSIVDVELQSRDAAASPWRQVAQHGFYRMETRNGEMRSGPLAIVPSSDRYWRIKTDPHGGGLGSVAPRLWVGWVPHEVLFVARGEGPFQLVYGSAVASPAAAGLTALPQNVAVASARVGAPHLLAGEDRLRTPEPPFPWKQVLLWATLGLGVALLGWMAYRLYRQM